MARPAVLLALLVACSGLAWATAPAKAAPSQSPPAGIFVLGIDGVDPGILQRMMDEGRMPYFASLAREGSYQPLGTSTPCWA